MADDNIAGGKTSGDISDSIHEYVHSSTNELVFRLEKNIAALFFTDTWLVYFSLFQEVISANPCS